MNITKHKLLIPILLFLFSFITIHLLHPNQTPYNYYTQLSHAFLQGNMCLQNNPSWLDELIFITGKGYCVVYPITPSILILPFVLLFPTMTQTFFSHLIFAFTTPIVYLLARRLKHTTYSSVFFSFTWCFGTIFLSLSAVGSAWYLAQTIGSTFLLASLLMLKKQTPLRLIGAGLLFGVAANARLSLHLYMIFFFVLFIKKAPNPKKFFLFVMLFVLGFLPFFTMQRWYNLARFDTIYDKGYYLIPGKFEEEDFKYGQFHPRNIPKHLTVFLLKPPKLTSKPPFIAPSYYGLSVLFTSPFLIIGLWWLIRNKKYAELVTIATVAMLNMSHGTVGFTQFGYRFGLDFYPFLFFGFISASKKLPKLLLYSLIGFSIIVNIWGVFSFRFNWFVW